jgi:hypothetical protein
MIPKQLFFIWFGDSIPNYVYYSIDSFKQMNQSYTVDLLYYNINDIINSRDSVIQTCKNYISLTKNGINNKYFKYIKRRIDSKFNYLQILSDFLRFELLYYYGGIYLDCDTFPVKPFDDLLNRNCFSQSILTLKPKKYKNLNLNDDYTYYYDYNFMNHLDKYLLYMYTDIYFIGSRKEFTDDDFVIDSDCICKNPLTPPWIRNFDNDKIFIKMSKDFYNEKLKLWNSHIFYTHYIMHFCKRTWQVKNYKDSPLYCELDDYLYGR